MGSSPNPLKTYVTIGFEDVGGQDTQVAVSNATPLPVAFPPGFSLGTVDVTDRPARDLGKVDVASLDQYTPINGRLPVDGSGVTQPVSITGTPSVDVTDRAARALGAVSVTSLDQYTPVNGRLPVDGSGVTQPISGSVSITGTPTVDVTDRTARQLGKVAVTSLDQYTPVNGRLPVDGSGVTQPVSGTVTTVPGSGTWPVAGDVAHDAVDGTSAPVKLGGRAAGATPTAVADADRVNAYLDREGRLVIRPWGFGAWVVNSNPGVNTQATVTKAAGGPGVRHVCTGFTAMLTAGATAPTATVVTVELLDGSTVLWSTVLGVPATAGISTGLTRSGLHIVGSPNTAMTFRFTAAAGANTYETVAMEGVSITES